MATNPIDILERHKSLASKRDLWKPLWQDLADILFPNRSGFTSPLIPGREAAIEIYDTTPMQARRALATAIGEFVMPSSPRRLRVWSNDPGIDDDDEAKAWFDVAADRMWGAIYDPQARLVQQKWAVDNDLSAFGLGYLWTGESRDRSRLAFRSLNIANCAIDEDSDGIIDTIFIERHFTARQAAQRFKNRIPPKVAEALGKTAFPAEKDKRFLFVQGIYPRADRDPRRADNLSMPFANCIVSVEDETIVEESGFQEFPVACPRWEVSAGEVYPRSPGMVALPDSRTLQSMGHTLLVGGQRAIDPPIWIADDAALSAVRTFPGGLTVIDSTSVRDTGGKPIGHLETGANIPIGREMQDDYRKMVVSAFYKEVFSLPQSSGMTATEVLERKQEFLRTAAPTLGPISEDYGGATLRRVFGIMMRAGAFLPPPDILLGRDVQFEFASPIQQARRQIETAGVARAFEFLGPIITLQPETADNFDGDEIVRDVPEAFDMPQRWIRGNDKVDGMRQARQQAAAQDGALAQGQQVAGLVKTAADADHAGGRGIAALTGAQAAQGAPQQ